MHSDQGSVDGAEDPDVSSVCLECARACALPAWIDAFRDVSWPTVVVPVGDDAAAFAGFLDAAGGMRLPAPPVDAALPPHDPRFALTRPSALDSAPDVGGDQQRHAPGGFAAAVVQSSDGGDGDDSTGSDGGASVATFSPPLPTLEAAMRAAIAELGGSAFVKLDWTAPADAAWAADAPDLQCPTPGHAFTLLGASDLVRYDVALLRALRAEAAVRGAPPPGAHVVLRAWFPLQRDGEFRCFVRRGALVAVSQRHTRERFAQLTGVGASARVRGALADFHARRVQPRFPLHTYTFDAYIDRRGRVWLVDFGPFGGDTDALLFSWRELGGGDAGGASASDGGGGGGGSCEHAARGAGAAAAGADAPPPAPVVRVVCEDPGMSFGSLAHHGFPDDLLALAAARIAGGGGAAGGGGVDALIDELRERRLF